jgi:hypothetical protein
MRLAAVPKQLCGCRRLRVLLPILAALLAACAPAPAPAPKPPPDPVTEDWYGPVTAQLAAMNRQAEALLRDAKSDRAAAIIMKGQPLASLLLAAPRPTLAAMEAASDLDQLYAAMLLRNRNYRTPELNEFAMPPLGRPA